MPTIKELGAGLGDKVQYYPSINGANYGPSYYPLPQEATIVGISEPFEITGHQVYEVFLYPPHEEDLPHWAIQDFSTGKITFLDFSNRKDFRYDQSTSRWEIVRRINGGRERFVSYHRGNDPDRFPAQTLGQALKDTVRGIGQAIRIEFDNFKAAW